MKGQQTPDLFLSLNRLVIWIHKDHNLLWQFCLVGYWCNWRESQVTSSEQVMLKDFSCCRVLFCCRIKSFLHFLFLRRRRLVSLTEKLLLALMYSPWLFALCWAGILRIICLRLLGVFRVCITESVLRMQIICFLSSSRKTHQVPYSGFIHTRPR